MEEQEVCGRKLISGNQINKIVGWALDQTGSAYSVVSDSCVVDQKRSDSISIQRGVGFLCSGSEKIRQDQHRAWCRILV